MTTDTQVSDNKPANCRFCGKPLAPGAIYCVECKHFQGRFREALSTFSPAFLLSLATLLGLGFTFLQRTVLLPRPAISATALTCASDKVVVAVENYGTRPAILTEGVAELTPGPAQSRKLWSDGLPLVIDPNVSKVVPLSLYSTGPDSMAEGGPILSPMPPRAGVCSYRISLKVADFAGVSRAPDPFSCAC
jgi:hypothetical protein